MKGSLQFRLTLSASITLAAFLGLAGITLDQAYREGQDQAMRERLQIYIYTLLASAELNDNKELAFSQDLPEPRFSVPDSGLIAYVVRPGLGVLWRSPSSLGIEELAVKNLSPGEKIVVPASENPSGLNAIHYQVVWDSGDTPSLPYEFVVAESPQALNDQLADYRQVLWLGLGGVGFLLVVVQVFVLRWSLKPVRTMVQDLEGIQMGASSQLDGEYGQELKGIAVTLNKLVENERALLQRYRNTMSDLAHSLKTPLSVLSNLWQQGHLEEQERTLLREQTQNMQYLVDYQLQRTVAHGHQTWTSLVEINPIVEQLVNSLEKVYRDKQIKLELCIDERVQYFCERGDFYELLGNLLDNACKWAKSRVRLTLRSEQNPQLKGPDLKLVIEDDGPGIAAYQLDKLLQRGSRADQTVAGQGIGLAVVKELVELYEGDLLAEKSDLGGHQWVLKLPSRI